MTRILIKENTASDTPPTGYVAIYAKSDGRLYTKSDAGVESPIVVQEEFVLDVSADETTALTTGTGKYICRMPTSFVLTEVRASVAVAPTAATIIVDINVNGSTILSTKLTIDAGEKTSTTAVTPAVISSATIADDAEISIDIDQVGGGVAGAGLKVYLIGAK